MTDTDRLLADSYLDGLEQRSTDEIRAMRAECVEYETGLSYFRRIVQGRVDIVARERQRRAEGHGPSDLSDLIGALPEILTEHRRPGGAGRLPQSLDAPDPDPDLVAELDDVAGPSVISRIGELDEEGLSALAERLGTIERRVSERRQAMFDRIDALQAELARRYGSGEADVGSLLS